MSAITIPIQYDLYRKSGEVAPGGADGDGAARMDSVTTLADLQLLAAIRAVDTARRVRQVDDRNQANVLHQYVLHEVPWEMPIDGHIIDFEEFETSVWNVKHRVWATPTWGASLVYPVRPACSVACEPDLFLVVATEGARARTETAHISQSV